MNRIKRAAARGATRLFRAAGLEVKRQIRTPRGTWLGLVHRPIRTIIDVGANEGQFAREARQHFPSARILCFEPQPGVFARLQRTASELGRVEAFGVALGPEPGEVDFHVHEQHDTSSSMLASTATSTTLYPETRRQRVERIRVETLDRIMATLDPPAEDEILMKLDVQGFEEHVLKGAEQTLSRVAACILEVCLDPLYEGQATFDSLYDRMRAAGLTYAGNLDQQLALDGHVSFFDAVFIRRPHGP